MSFKAEIIADSIVSTGERLTTFIVTFPRIVLAEFNTHRMFSRNSASSRAIPFKKMVKMVEENPFIPLAWQLDHPGMQGTTYLNEEETKVAISEWLEARDSAVAAAKKLNKEGSAVTKQLCNRLLESFMWHTVIVTATEWENFFGLRAHQDAEIHIQKLAYMMLEEYNKSEPKLLAPGKWHIPFGDKFSEDKIKSLVFRDEQIGYGDSSFDSKVIEYKVRIASARCARVSYTVVGEEGKPDNYEADLKLCDRLASSGHWSALEHCAKAMTKHEYEMHVSGNSGNYNPLTHVSIISDDIKGWCGNFRGFIQYRKTFENENRTDFRVKTKKITEKV